MAPNLPQHPTCERRATPLSDADVYLLHRATTSSACVQNDYDPQSALDHDQGGIMDRMIFPDSTKLLAPHDSDLAKHSLPCCTQAFCDFDLHPTVDPSLSSICVDASACFDFACLDETCLEYAGTPCQEPGCAEPTTTTCDDPCCEDTTAATADCAECVEEHGSEACTTCCMADVCPNPAHAHLPKHFHPTPTGYVPWYQHFTYPYHNQNSICSSERSSVEPRLSAALSSLSYASPTVTNPASTPSGFDSISLDTPSSQRGGHRRLQGAAARQLDGSYMCHWVTDLATGLTCGHCFSDAQGLHEHIQACHFAGSASHHPCHWAHCDSGVFNTKPKLARHLHSHTEYKPHKCDHPGCTLSFVTQQQRDVHKKKHTGEKPFVCDVCGKAFAYMDLLKSHMRSGVHGQADKKFPCVICGEGFSDSSNRTKHTKSVHDPLTAVPCPEPGCTYMDTRREKLRYHCETFGHASSLMSATRNWEEYFNKQQALRKPHRGHKKKRSAVQAGFELI